METQAQTRRRPRSGRRRARKLSPGERVSMSFRVPPDIKRMMDSAADQNGRSLAQEIELRLTRSFNDDPIDDGLRLAYGPQGRDLLRLLGHAVQRAPIGWDWLNQPREYAFVAAQLIEILRDGPLKPAGEVDYRNAETHARARKRAMLRSALSKNSPLLKGFDPAARDRIVDWLENPHTTANADDEGTEQ